MVLKVSGDEAILVSKILHMYVKYAEAQGWSIAVFPDRVVLRGENAFHNLQFESGVHRIQWVPPTEEQGRVFTAKVMVNVTTEGDESDGPVEKIRTYNFPQNRVTDHRIAFTLHELDRIMDGKLDPIIKALTGRYGGESA